MGEKERKENISNNLFAYLIYIYYLFISILNETFNKK